MKYAEVSKGCELNLPRAESLENKALDGRLGTAHSEVNTIGATIET
jgi:hypothetical protein